MSNILESIYFTSELNLGRVKDIEDRGFNNSLEMSQYVIENWNSTIKPDDTVYILGGLTWLPTELTTLDELNGNINIVPGPYDNFIKDASSIRSLQNSKVQIKDMIDIKRIGIGGKRVDLLLSYYPMLTGEHSIQLYGNSGKLIENVDNELSDSRICVSWNTWKKPISLYKLVNLFDLEDKI